MRKSITAIAAAAALLLLAGLRIFGIVGSGGGRAALAGDGVRYGTTPLALQIVKGEPNARTALADTPFMLWEYAHQTAFGRECAIVYRVWEGGGPLETVFLSGVTAARAEIPVADAEDGENLFALVCARLGEDYARRGGRYCEDLPAALAHGVLNEAFFSANDGVPAHAARVRQYENHVCVETEFSL